jgi:hypothetical protein
MSAGNRRSGRGAHAASRQPRTQRVSRKAKVAGAIFGALLAASVGYAASNWIVGLNSGSNGEAESTAAHNLTVSAVATPAPTHLLYPGSTGDVVVTITNPNPFPVTLSALKLPASAVFAAGFTTSALTTSKTGCAVTSGTTGTQVTWTGASGTSGASHTLTTALKVAASGNTGDPLKVVLTGEATMGASAPTACQSTYFSMPSLIGVTATAGITGTVTSSPATDKYS